MIYDVIIVGGSFSGLSSAYFLAQKGLKVCLFEGRKFCEILKRFTDLRYMHARKTFLPYLFNLNRLGKIIQLLK